MKQFLCVMLIAALCYCSASLSELRIVCTAALLDDKFEMRKNEYVQCLTILANYGYKNVYVVEALKGSGPTFLDDYSTNVFYSKAHDFSIKDMRNKGINEARTLLDGFNHFNFHPDDMVLKITGRYHLKSDKILRLINENPDVDAFVRLIHDGTWPITGCFALRYRYFKDLLEHLDYKHMEENHIYIEHKVMDYLNAMKKEGTGKIMIIDELDLSANVLGWGQYSLMNL
jgi:hypothetical protein